MMFWASGRSSVLLRFQQKCCARRRRIHCQASTSAWLASGGDGRVTLHEENLAFQSDDDIGHSRKKKKNLVLQGINAYGTSTHPRPHIIERSSCTSSSPKQEAFEHVDSLRENLVLDWKHLNTNDQEQPWPPSVTKSLSALVESNRERLLSVLGLKAIKDDTGTTTDDEDKCAVIMCASGTDAELLGGLMGIAASGPDSPAFQQWVAANQQTGLAVANKGASLLSVLMPGTGSGVGDAAGMRHHSAAAPQANKVQPGEPIEGMVDGLVVAVEPARDGIDLTSTKDLEKYIREKQDQTKAGSVVLHAIAGSKTGLHQPPIHVADALSANNKNLLVVVDACQMRVTPEYIRSQLSKGYIVLLTGSKFYGGPPFAGACLLPPSRAKELEVLASVEGGIPKGLNDYFTQDDVPESLPIFRSKLQSIPNTGLALRWGASLHSMERFQKAPAHLTNKVAKLWVSRLKALAEGFYPSVEVLEIQGMEDELEHRIGSTNTIVSLMVRTGTGGLLGVKGLKQLQLLLGTDLSDLCDDVTFPRSAIETAKIQAQLGQPVLLGGGATHGVLRMAIGATDICQVVESTLATSNSEDPFEIVDALQKALDAMVVQDVQVLRKLELIATHWEAVAKCCDELPSTALRWQARLAAEGVVDPCPQTKPQEIALVDIDWLKPHEMVVHQDRVSALVEAIGRWGAYRKPLLVDKESGSILDGHHRYFAAIELGLSKVPVALVDYLNDDSISVDLWPGDHGVTSISKQDVIDMCLSADVFPPKTSRHTFAQPLLPIFVPLEELHD